MNTYLDFNQVSFCYDSMQQPLYPELNLHFAPGWTGIVGANGAGKSTLLKLAAGVLEPDAGHIFASGEVVYCEQRTDDMPDGLDELLEDTSGFAQTLISQLNVKDDWATRWNTLSHGERKRAQIAVMLWRRPSVLALDEPSNHIDGQTRERLMLALKGYRGVGLLVSHDREMLDSLCFQCLFLDPPEARLRPGGVTAGMEQERIEKATMMDEVTRVRHQVDRLQKERQRRRELADQAMAKNTKAGLSAKDHDQRDKIRLGRITGKDAVGAHFAEQLSGRLRHAQSELAELHVRKDCETGIWLTDGGYSRRSWLVRFPEGSIPLGETRRLAFPEVMMGAQEHVALTGDNGAGKSTFIAYILEHLNIEPERLVYIPQEIGADDSAELLKRVKALDKSELGTLMTIISRLGTRPYHLLESTQPSPGETRKLLLAMGITRAPHLIVMDEPTNHMDLPSIQCLEDALKDCPCGLLLVSHDRVFLKAVTDKEWHIECGDDVNRIVWRNL